MILFNIQQATTHWGEGGNEARLILKFSDVAFKCVKFVT